MRKTYFLPEKLRLGLRKIWGIPVFGKKSEVEKKFRKILKEKKFKKLITVGDYCSLNLPSEIKIFDGQIRRKKVKKNPKFSLKGYNPSGTIQNSIWPKIEKAIKERKNLFINGEEDLLVIPAVLLSKTKSAVIYGIFNKGVCLIEVTPQIKKNFKELLKKFAT